MLLFEASPQCHQKSRQTYKCPHLEAGAGDKNLVSNWPFAPLLRSYNSPRAQSPICAWVEQSNVST